MYNNSFTSFLIFSYFFKDKLAKLDILKNNLNNLNMLHNLIIVDDDFNTLHLPNLILKTLKYYKKPILFLPNNNNNFVKKFRLKSNIDFDFDFDIGYIINSRIRIFNYTNNSIKYLKDWIYLNNISSEIIEIDEFFNIEWLDQINSWDKNLIKIIDFTSYLKKYITQNKKVLIGSSIKIIKPNIVYKVK
jgi:hypothetical protein